MVHLTGFNHSLEKVYCYYDCPICSDENYITEFLCFNKNDDLYIDEKYNINKYIEIQGKVELLEYNYLYVENSNEEVLNIYTIPSIELVNGDDIFNISTLLKIVCSHIDIDTESYSIDKIEFDNKTFSIDSFEIYPNNFTRTILKKVDNKFVNKIHCLEP